ncbi:hypothetical protein [Actinomycetospora straminea]|uniref:Uncharacterized protein n=1 Tax=Actinomycetospora straminea TaxID=663607 RepID=A0ABP9F6N1_9PSEU|nr:hypothetical protein [Actinomycetospora straminea]MDD7936745.1 hypothetical protein [Actinomycetospora straminea]
MAFAVERMTDEAGERMAACYAEYVAAATANSALAGPLYGKDPEGNEAKGREYQRARRALYEAAAAVWTTQPAGAQLGLF